MVNDSLNPEGRFFALGAVVSRTPYRGWADMIGVDVAGRR